MSAIGLLQFSERRQVELKPQSEHKTLWTRAPFQTSRPHRWLTAAALSRSKSERVTRLPPIGHLEPKHLAVAGRRRSSRPAQAEEHRMSAERFDRNWQSSFSSARPPVSSRTTPPEFCLRTPADPRLRPHPH